MLTNIFLIVSSNLGQKALVRVTGAFCYVNIGKKEG